MEWEFVSISEAVPRLLGAFWSSLNPQPEPSPQPAYVEPARETADERQRRIREEIANTTANILVVGDTQASGKTETTTALIIEPVLRARTKALIDIDPHRSAVLKTIALAYHYGLQEQLVVIDPQSRIITSAGIFKTSASPDPYEREKENRERARVETEAMCSGWNEDTLSEPFVYEWLSTMIEAGKYCDIPLIDMPYLLQPGSAAYERFAPTISSDRLRIKVLELRELVKNSHFKNLLQSCRRRCDRVFFEPVFRNMLEPTFSLPDLVKARGILVYRGSGDPLLDRMIVKPMLHDLIGIAKTSHDAHLIRVDESPTILNDTEASAANQTLKWLQQWLLLSQQGYPDPVLNDKIQSACTIKMLMFQSSKEQGQLSAYQMRRASDAYAVHHHTERMVPTGEYETIPTESKTVSKRDGQKTTGTSHGTRDRQIYTEDIQAHYATLADQDILHSQKLLSYYPGEFTLINGPRIETDCYYPMVEIEGDLETLADEHLQKQLADGISRLPEPPRTTCQTPAPSASQHQTPHPNNRTGNRPSRPGMR